MTCLAVLCALCRAGQYAFLKARHIARSLSIAIAAFLAAHVFTAAVETVR
jgi:hypothetical protein